MAVVALNGLAIGAQRMIAPDRQDGQTLTQPFEVVREEQSKTTLNVRFFDLAHGPG